MVGSSLGLWPRGVWNKQTGILFPPPSPTHPIDGPDGTPLSRPRRTKRVASKVQGKKHVLLRWTPAGREWACFPLLEAVSPWLCSSSSEVWSPHQPSLGCRCTPFCRGRSLRSPPDGQLCVLRGCSAQALGASSKLSSPFILFLNPPLVEPCPAPVQKSGIPNTTLDFRRSNAT